MKMTKQEAISIINDNLPRCPACKQIAARLVMSFPKNVDAGTLEKANIIRWQYTGSEKHV